MVCRDRDERLTMRRVLVMPWPLTHRYAKQGRPPLHDLAPRGGQQLEVDLSQVAGIDATGAGMLRAS